MSTERSHELTRRLAQEEGILAGVSSGAALGACLDLAARIREGIIVTVFPDSGTRYLTERFWEGRDSMTSGVGNRVTTITAAALEAIRAHGVQTFPDECCGALIEVGGVIVEAFALPEHHHQRRRAAVPDQPGRLPRVRSPRDPSCRARWPASIIRTRTIRPARRSTISSRPGRISAT